jgi:alginate O-acetyltransferase complex protein AlgI
MATTTFLMSFLLYWLFLCATCIVCGIAPRREIRAALAAIIPFLFAGLLVVEFSSLWPWQRLWLGTIGLLFSIKASVLLLHPHVELRSFSRIGFLLYMSVWPGMDPQPFAGRVQCLEDGRRFVRGYICFWLGLVCFFMSSVAAFPLAITNWSCLVGLLLMIHFGYAEMLSCAVRLAGWNVQPLFDAPLLSNSLQDFWSRRWNLAFVEMDKLLFLPLAKRLLKPRAAIFVIFIISGLLHEIGISYASGQLWGLPLLYFLIQGAGIIIEKRLFATRQSWPVAARAFALVWVLAPLPLLFNHPFQHAFIAPLSLLVKQSASNLTPHWLLNQALWLAAAGHFCTLIAGLQVPFRLHWKEELSRLSSFNRKILLYCAAYVGLMIITFGSLTFALHDQLLTGQRSAVFLSLIIAIFWIARLLVDCFYFHHSDWPKGTEFVIGHTLLNTLFLFLAGVYSSLVWLNWAILLSPSPTSASHLAPNLTSVQGDQELLFINHLWHTVWQWTGSLAPQGILSQALWLAAIGNFCALTAGAQMPIRLHWAEELGRLSNFNRKIMINYAAYVFMMIMAFGLLTFALHDQFLIGDKPAVSLALVMALFWILRLVADFFYFNQSDWPKATEFVIAHRLLNMLFVFLAGVYSSVVLLNWLLPHVLTG